MRQLAVQLGADTVQLVAQELWAALPGTGTFYVNVSCTLVLQYPDYSISVPGTGSSQLSAGHGPAVLARLCMHACHESSVVRIMNLLLAVLQVDQVTEVPGGLMPAVHVECLQQPLSLTLRQYQDVTQLKVSLPWSTVWTAAAQVHALATS